MNCNKCNGKINKWKDATFYLKLKNETEKF
jgi:hypothetical protein